MRTARVALPPRRLHIHDAGPYPAVLSTTFSVALWTTALCVGLGYPLAYWLARKPPRQQRIAALFVLLPLLLAWFSEKDKSGNRTGTGWKQDSRNFGVLCFLSVRRPGTSLA